MCQYFSSALSLVYILASGTIPYVLQKMGVLNICSSLEIDISMGTWTGKAFEDVDQMDDARDFG